VGLVVKPDHIQVVCIFQIAHRSEWHVDDPIDVVVPRLHLGRQHTDHFKTQAVNSYAFSQSVPPRKQFLLALGTDHRDVRALHLVLCVVEPSLVDSQRMYVDRVGVLSRDRHRESTDVVLNVCVFADVRGDMGNLWEIGGEDVDIVKCQAQLLARLLPTRLHRGTAGDNNHQLGAEISEDVGTGLSETVAVGQQDDDRGDAPRHTQYGQGSAAPVVPHGRVGFLEQIPSHRTHSCRKASTGSSIAALRAGYMPATTPAATSVPMASIALEGTSRGGSNPPGPWKLPMASIRAPA